MSDEKGGGDDDLQLEPMYKGRSRAVLIGVGLLAMVGVAIVVNSRINATRREAELRRAGAAWSELEHCLVGDTLPVSERPSHRARQIEIAAQQTARANESQPRRRRWPYRCATHADVLTHALIESKAEDTDHRMLAMLASRASLALEAGELRTGEHDRLTYLDEMFEQARRTPLPAPAGPPTGPLPPEPAHPLTPRTMSALFAGAEANVLVGTDPVAGAALTLLTGQGRRRVCELRGSYDSPGHALEQVRCRELTFADAPLEAELVPADDAAGPHVLVRTAGGRTGNVFDTDHPSAAAVARDVSAAYARADGSLAVLTRSAPPEPNRRASPPPWTFARMPNGNALVVPVPFVPPVEPLALLAGPAVLPDHVLLAAAPPPAPSPAARPGPSIDAGTTVATRTADAATAPDAGGAPSRLIAADVSASVPPVIAFHDLGAGPSLAADARIAMCRTPQALVAVVRGSGDSVAVTVLENNHWSAPVTTTAPAAATLTCRGAQGTLTWAETGASVLVRQAHCTASGCRTAQGPLPQYDNTHPLVAAIDDRVLVVASPGPSHGLVMRVAPLEEIDRVDDVIVIDDADHGGLALEPPRHLFVRGRNAVVLVTNTGLAAETYAVRLDAGGAFAAVVVDSGR